MELLRVGCVMTGLAFWAGLHTWSWQGRHWLRMPELLDDAGSRDYGEMGSWRSEGASSADALS